jgi:hypothetical protein
MTLNIKLFQMARIVIMNYIIILTYLIYQLELMAVVRQSYVWLSRSGMVGELEIAITLIEEIKKTLKELAKLAKCIEDDVQYQCS